MSDKLSAHLQAVQSLQLSNGEKVSPHSIGLATSLLENLEQQNLALINSTKRQHVTELIATQLSKCYADGINQAQKLSET